MTNTPVSRQFPANPSLEQLRKMAKEHLKEMRLASGEVTLSQAQFSLARSYGSSSWRALKEEVERRRGTFCPPAPQIGAFLTRPAVRIHRMPDAGRAEQAFGPLSTMPLLAMLLIPFAEPLILFTARLLH